ncbi:RNA 2',3'-cyclic phosphodiesterase [Celeribacter halophilus]|uniref:RNA 2',3'-cyclic phosphodiesterase n=1 Tax=Celeribacter halophilus TaxID=576117 RepID=A0A1I3S3N0_9RHOB|nr:RNA 2',3'-cyclic phosphodiesterase [Celeribacter halophilus]PZX11465.1 2'-5' RNA ligase [Celeribacter halophilus]SFJ53394.1 2'-5' RNA ligase [Celeribacter halophilus]
MRAFVGLPLPDDLTDRLEALAAPLRFGRAVPAENMHVTLAFLDDQPEELLAELHEELASLCLPAPEIAVAGLDVFGGNKPRLLFASVRQDDALTALRNKVRQAARAVGIDLPHERFRPHISLRRFHRLRAGEQQELDHLIAAQGAFAWPAFQPPECAMIGSTLTPEGAQYDTLATYPLG